MSDPLSRWQTLGWLLAHELRSLVREPFALVLLFVTPILVMPLVATAVGGVSRQDAARIDETTLTVSVSVALEHELGLDWAALKLQPVPPETPAADVHLDPTEAGVGVRYRGDRWRSAAAVERLGPGLEAWQARVQNERWTELGVDRAPKARWKVQRVDHVPAEVRQDAVAARGLAPMLVFLLLTGGLYVALDRLAGEKERGSLETLLASRLPRRWILVSKAIVIGGVAYLLAACTTLAFVLGHATGVVEGALPGALGVAPSPAALGWVLAMLVPLTASLVCGLLAVAAWVPGFREGQALGIPILLLGSAPALVAAVPGVELGPVLAVVPVAGVSLALRDAVAGTLSLGMGAWVWAAALGHAAVMWRLACQTFELDTVLIGRGRFRSDPDDHRLTAFGTFGGALVATWFIGQLAQAHLGVWGVVLTLVGLVALPAVLGAVVSGRPMRAVFAVSRPSRRDLALGLVLGLSVPAVGDLITRLQSSVLPSTAARTQALGEAMDLGVGLGATLLVLAVLPALCEELLFRGTILRLLRTRMSATAAVVTSALMFGFFHLDLTRLLPTAALGAIFAVASLRSRSVWPAVVAHGLNNAVWVVLVASGSVAVDADLPVWLDLCGVVVVVGCLAAMGRPAVVSPNPIHPRIRADAGYDARALAPRPTRRRP